MHPSWILSTYPPKEIDDKLEKCKPKKIHLYVDVKNSSRALFVDEVVAEIVHNTDVNQSIDSNIFQSTMFYASWWKKFAKCRNLEIEIFFFTDSGTSEYHIGIDKKYKKSRRVGSVDLPFYYKDIEGIKKKNFELCERLYNRIEGIYYFNLSFLESDFIPYYLKTRKYPDKDIFNIICSNDKDLLQCVEDDHSVMIFKLRDGVTMIDSSKVFHRYIGYSKSSVKNKIKKIGQIRNMSNEYLSPVMAFVGDKIDGIEGVKSIGPGRSLEIFSDKVFIKKYIGSYDELVDRVLNENEFFKTDELSTNKYLNKAIENKDVVTNSFKLISFEHLCRWLEQKDKLSKIKKIDYIDNILSKEHINIIKSPVTLLETVNKLPDSVITMNEVKNLI